MILRVDSTTIRRWIRNNILLAVELPHPGRRQSYRIKRETIENMLGEPVSVDTLLLRTTRHSKGSQTSKDAPSGGDERGSSEKRKRRRPLIAI
jgi:hypothetical protein